ncbi:MAG: hypothetical protein ACREN4_06150 [Candidatus Dormibacteria bacterium]
MRSKFALGLVPLAAVALLAGCGGAGFSQSRPAGKILAAANSITLGQSFQVNFSAQMSVDLSHVKGLGSVTQSELDLIQSEISAARLEGTVQMQNSSTIEGTLTLPPLLKTPVHLIDLDGAGYISYDGTHWYQQSASAGTGATLQKLRGQFQTWGKQLQGQAQVVNKGDTTFDGTSVDHLQTTVPGAALNTFMAQEIAGLSAVLPTLGPQQSSEIKALEQLIQFTGETGDTYVNTANGHLVHASGTTTLDLQLGALALLAPGQSGLPSGYAGITFTVSGDFSDWGQQFNIQKPGHVLPGLPPAPSGLSGSLSSL